MPEPLLILSSGLADELGLVILRRLHEMETIFVHAGLEERPFPRPEEKDVIRYDLTALSIACGMNVVPRILDEPFPCHPPRKVRGGWFDVHRIPRSLGSRGSLNPRFGRPNRTATRNRTWR